MIQQSETALEKVLLFSASALDHTFSYSRIFFQRVAQRNDLYLRISAAIVNVQNSSEHCSTTASLLHSTVLETQTSVRERIAQQASTIIVLKKMKDTLQPVRAGILQRCELAAQFVNLQTTLVSDAGTVVLQVIFILNTTFPTPHFAMTCALSTPHVANPPHCCLLGPAAARGTTAGGLGASS